MDDGPVSRLRVAAVAAQGPHSPGFRIRLMLAAERLARHGIEVVPVPLWPGESARRFEQAQWRERGRLLFQARRQLRRRLREDDFDVVFLQRQADLLGTLSLERDAIAGRALVYDVDDA